MQSPQFSFETTPKELIVQTSILARPALPSSGEKRERRYLDYQTIKKDHDYELAFLRGKDGSALVSSALFSNMALIHRLFYETAGKKARDLLHGLEEAQDHFFDSWITQILSRIRHEEDRFFTNIYGRELTLIESELASALMALHFAKGISHIADGHHKKRYQYVRDFFHFFKNALAIGDEEEAHLQDKIVDAIFSQKASYRDLYPILADMLDKSLPEEISLWKECAADFIALKKEMAPIALLPVIKTREVISLSENSYTPLYQDNPPLVLYTMKVFDKSCDLLHLPSVTTQEILEEASIEKIASRYFQNENESILIVNLQDKTSFKEIGRVLALEKFSKDLKNVDLISLPCATDFYYQSGPYHDVADTAAFFHLIMDQIKCEGTGFEISERWKKNIIHKIGDISNDLLKGLFAGRHLLSHQERQDFITWLYLLITLEAIHDICPSKVAFVTKDGVDLAPTFSALLYTTLSNGKLSKSARQDLKGMLFMPALLVRGRAPHEESIHRFIRALRRLEEGGSLKVPSDIHISKNELS